MQRLEGGQLDYTSQDVAVIFQLAGDDIRSSSSDRAIGADGNDYTGTQRPPATHVRFWRDAPAARQQFLAVIVPYRQGKPQVETIDPRHARIAVDGKTETIGFGVAAADTVDFEAIQRSAR